MREELKKRLGEPVIVYGRYERSGSTRDAGKGRIHLLLSIKEAFTGETLTDHIWFKLNTYWVKQRDDIFILDTNVIQYETLYKTDYRLNDSHNSYKIVAHLRPHIFYNQILYYYNLDTTKRYYISEYETLQSIVDEILNF